MNDNVYEAFLALYDEYPFPLEDYADDIGISEHYLRDILDKKKPFDIKQFHALKRYLHEIEFMFG